MFGFRVLGISGLMGMRLMAEGFIAYGLARRSDAICRTTALQDRL